MTSQHSTDSPNILLVDDHEMILNGTLYALEQAYPNATITKAQSASEALEKAAQTQFDLTILDLSMPDTTGEPARLETGLQLVTTLIESYPTMNIVVQSAHVQSLIRILPNLHAHESGLVVIDKSSSVQDMLTKVECALQGAVHTPKEIRHGLELKEQWIELLHLAFNEELTDRAIGQRMNIAQRTVRNYWSQIQNALDLCPDDENHEKNLRIQIGNRARELGLIQ